MVSASDRDREKLESSLLKHQEGSTFMCYTSWWLVENEGLDPHRGRRKMPHFHPYNASSTQIVTLLATSRHGALLCSPFVYVSRTESSTEISQTAAHSSHESVPESPRHLDPKPKYVSLKLVLRASAPT